MRVEPFTCGSMALFPAPFYFSTFFSIWVQCPVICGETREMGHLHSRAFSALRDLSFSGSLLGLDVYLWSLRELFAHLDPHLQMFSSFTKVWHQLLWSLEGSVLKRADPNVKTGQSRCPQWSLPSAHSMPSLALAAMGTHGFPCPASV